MTKDYDFRINLKEGDIIDCYLDNKFYPATILKVNNIEIDKKDYLIGFRIYIDSINKNTELEKYKKFWKSEEIKVDKNKREYIGKSENFDEEINCLSLRICKKDSKIFEDEVKVYDDELHLYIDHNILPVKEENGKKEKALIIGRKMKNSLNVL